MSQNWMTGVFPKRKFRRVVITILDLSIVLHDCAAGLNAFSC